MAEEVLYSFVNHLMSWIEYLHEKNLKYQAQYESILKDLNDSKTCCEELKARLSAYESGDETNLQQQQQHQHQQQQQVSIAQTQLHHLQPTNQAANLQHYQPTITVDPTQGFVTTTTAVPPAGQYMWTTTHEMPITHMPVPYYDQQPYTFHQS